MGWSKVFWLWRADKKSNTLSFWYSRVGKGDVAEVLAYGTDINEKFPHIGDAVEVKRVASNVRAGSFGGDLFVRAQEAL